MKSNALVVMGYPNKPNKNRFNSNRTLSNSFNSKNAKVKQK